MLCINKRIDIIMHRQRPTIIYNKYFVYSTIWLTLLIKSKLYKHNKTARQLLWKKMAKKILIKCVKVDTHFLSMIE